MTLKPRSLILGIGLAGFAVAQANAAAVKIKIEDDALEPQVELSTPHKLTWKSGAEAWLRGYVDKRTGVLTLQILVTTNAMDRTKAPAAINYLSAEGPIQKVVSETPAPLGRCPEAETCSWKPLERPVPIVPCRGVQCAVDESFSVGWLVTTISPIDAKAAASSSGPWRYKVKDKMGGEFVGELPAEYFAALLLRASDFAGAR